MTRVLVVDDHEENLLYLSALLRGRGCQVETARHGAEALTKARQQPPDIVISDLLMPVMDGYTLLRHWKHDERLRRVPFVVYTATYTDPQDERLALDLGADAFVLKPAEPEPFWARLEEILAQAATGELTAPRQPAVEPGELLDQYDRTLVRKLEQRSQQLEDANLRLEGDIAERVKAELALRESLAETARVAAALQSSTERLKRTVDGAIEAMGAMVAVRDPYTAGHERRVTALAVAIAEEMETDEGMTEGLRLAGLVHDVGKLMVPAEILVRPTRLPPTEFELIKRHPVAAYEILKSIDFDFPVAKIVLQHHERLDGSGYPSGIRGDEILPEARLLAVADVVEAMASHRPYRAALGLESALEEVRSGAGTRYEAEFVAACERVFQKGFEFAEP